MPSSSFWQGPSTSLLKAFTQPRKGLLPSLIPSLTIYFRAKKHLGHLTLGDVYLNDHFQQKVICYSM